MYRLFLLVKVVNMLKITIIQMEIKDGEKGTNLKNALRHLREVSNKKSLPDIVCLPELFTTGYDLKNVKALAEPLNDTEVGETISKIRKVSEDNFMVIGTILEKEENHFYNTAFILGKGGDLIGKYRKSHLFSPMLEKEYLTPGKSIQTFTVPDLDDLKIGLAICYDLRFPELFRTITLDGADIIFIPSEFPSPKKDVWKTLLMARAIENQVYCVGVNRVGKGSSDLFFGTSIITNGDTQHIMGSSQAIKTFEIDLSELKKIRKALPLLKDRRNSLYEL